MLNKKVESYLKKHAKRKYFIFIRPSKIKSKWTYIISFMDSNKYIHDIEIPEETLLNDFNNTMKKAVDMINTTL